MNVSKTSLRQFRLFGRGIVHRAVSIATAAASVICFFSGCNAKPAAQATKSKPIADLAAETLEIGYAPWPKIVRSQGELRADEVVAIGTRVAGRVSEVHADLGDQVQAGQPLVTLDPEEFRLLVAQAEAQLAQTRSAVGLAPEAPVESLKPENSPPVRQERAVWDEAKSSLQRANQLRTQNAMAAGEFDLVAVAERVAEARYASALNGTREKLALIGVRQAELSLARQRLEDAVIKAPFDGFVQQRAVAPGAYVNVSDPLFSIVRIDPLWFRGTLPERYASQVRVGIEIDIRIQSMTRPINASITRVSPSLDPQSRSLVFEAKIVNADNQLRTGLFAEADVILNPNAESLVVPTAAVTQFAGAEKVWQVIDNLSIQKEIIAGTTRGDYTEVIDGLKAGDVVLADGEKGRLARIVPLNKPATTKPNELKPAQAMIELPSQAPEG